MLASLIDSATNLANRATDYPLLVKVVFVATLVLWLVCVFVYALLFPSATPDEAPAVKSDVPG